MKKNPPILKKKMPKEIHGMTFNDGEIHINKNLSPVQQKIAISHEKVHRKQIRDGRLSYDENFIYWNGKKYSRKKIKEGARNLPWEKEAYDKQLKK